MSTALAGEVLLRGPSRLHFGLLNESGAFGRIDGGVGCSISSPSWRLRMFLAEQPSVVHLGWLDSETQSTVEALLEKIRRRGRRAIGVEVFEAVPSHAGLGAKTALLMAIGKGAQVLNLIPEHDERALGSFVGRGGTSGIGIHASAHGGVVADAGRRFPIEKQSFVPSSRSAAYPPRQVLRISVPDELKVIHFRFAPAGPSGEAEASLFSRACPISTDETRDIISVTYGELIPSLVDFDEGHLNAGLAALQELGMKRYEWDSQAEVTRRFREYFATVVPDTALCLSSMGPTMFTLSTRVDPILDAVRAFQALPLHCIVTNVSEVGTSVEAQAVGP